MEKYSKAVSEMYAQFKKREPHPMEKYVGRLVSFSGEKTEVVGYSYSVLGGEPLLIVDASQSGGLVGAGAFRRRIQRVRVLLVCKY